MTAAAQQRTQPTKHDSPAWSRQPALSVFLKITIQVRSSEEKWSEVMTSMEVEVFDDTQDIVDGWLKGKGREKLTADTSTDVAVGALSHASTMGLGYTGQREPPKQEHVFTREDEILRKMIVTAKRKGWDLKKVLKKSKNDDDSDDDRLMMRTSADRDLEVSRTAISGKKVKPGLKEGGDIGSSESSSSSGSNSAEKGVPNITESTVEQSLAVSAEDSEIKVRSVCINYSEFGKCRFGSSCRYSHKCEPGSNEPFAGFVRQRTRKKTRSKQKNIRKDTRSDELKPQKGRLFDD